MPKSVQNWPKLDTFIVTDTNIFIFLWMLYRCKYKKNFHATQSDKKIALSRQNRPKTSFLTYYAFHENKSILKFI